MVPNSKNILMRDDAQAKLTLGLTKVADLVATTMGPSGRVVVCRRAYGGQLVTKDGVTVAREAVLSDETEETGASLLREAAQKTVDEAGDGTTATCVLTAALLREGNKMIRDGVDPQELRRAMDDTYSTIAKELATVSKPITTDEELEQVATISANDATLGKLVADAWKRVGKQGILVLERGNTNDIEVDIVQGMRFNHGYVSPHFVTDKERLEAEYEDMPLVLIDGQLNSVLTIVPLIDKIAKELGKQQCLIIAEDFSPEVIGTFAVNKQKGVYAPLLIKAPGIGPRRLEYLEDLAIMTGAQVITDGAGLKLDDKTLVSVVGTVHRVVADATKTTIIGSNTQDVMVAIASRVSSIQKELDTVTFPADKDRLERRIANLTGGIGVIRVGANTEADMKEKYHRLEDAVLATRSAQEEGIVMGGGMALYRIAQSLTISERSSDIVVLACKAPLRTIVENTGLSFQVIEKELLMTDGFNAKTRECVQDMFTAGIIDPTKVIRVALKNAVSVAGLLLTCGGAVIDVPIESKK